VRPVRRDVSQVFGTQMLYHRIAGHPLPDSTGVW
jgi:hypothetical protein